MRYYCIKQHDITDCGVACLATICKQNGYKIDITQICEVAGTDKLGIAVECPSKNGVSSTFMNRIMKTINKSNISGKYIR